MAARILHPDGTIERIEENISMERAQKALDSGLVKVAHEAEDSLLLVNSMLSVGDVEEMEHNDFASVIANKYLVGPALLLTGDSRKGWGSEAEEGEDEGGEECEACEKMATHSVALCAYCHSQVQTLMDSIDPEEEEPK